MSNDKKVDKTIVYYILGGAALGAIAGYIVKKVGMKNIVNVLKAKKIFPEGFMDTISEFTDRSRDDDLEEDNTD